MDEAQGARHERRPAPVSSPTGRRSAACWRGRLQDPRLRRRPAMSSLTAAVSPFQTALTALLTIYVALIGYRMLFASGGARLSDGPGIALKIGAILALVTSWATFQTLVFDVAAQAPLEIAAPDRRAVPGPAARWPPIRWRACRRPTTSCPTAALAFGKPSRPNGADLCQPRRGGGRRARPPPSGVLFMTSAGVDRGRDHRHRRAHRHRAGVHRPVPVPGDARPLRRLGAGAGRRRLRACSAAGC